MAEQIEQDLRTDEVAKALRLHTATVQRLLVSKQLKGYKIGRHWRIPPSALKHFQQVRLRAMEMPQTCSEPKRQWVLKTTSNTKFSTKKAAPSKMLNNSKRNHDEEFRQWLKGLKQMSRGIPPLPLEVTRREHLYGSADR